MTMKIILHTDPEFKSHTLKDEFVKLGYKESLVMNKIRKLKF